MATSGTAPGKVAKVNCAASAPTAARSSKRWRCRPAPRSPASNRTAANASSAAAAAAASCAPCAGRSAPRLEARAASVLARNVEALAVVLEVPAHAIGRQAKFFERVFVLAEAALRVGGHHLLHRRFDRRSEEHTSELQSLMRISYA